MADQGSLFDKNANPARVGPSDATADRGHGAAAGHVAREAVRQDAVDHGSADPDSLWTQRQRARSKRAAEEHRAIGADHAELFVFTPGSQLVASKPVDPFKGFTVQWDRARDAALAGYGGLDEGRIRLFLNARSVAATGEGDGHRVTVDLAGYRFTATGTTLLDALDALSRRTSKGIERAEGLAPKQAVAPTALELANARRSPEERLERAAYGYFLSRKLTFTKSRDRHLSFALNDEDVRQAGLIGVVGPADRGAHDAIVAFFQAIDARTMSANVEGWEGLTKEAFGAEGLERTSQRVASIEGLRTSRYVDDGAARATAAHAALPAGSRPGPAAGT